MKNVALIGLGPHAKRIYLNYLRKHEENLSLVVDLESKMEDINKYLKNNGFMDTKTLSLKDEFKDNKHLPEAFYNNLLSLCKKLKITHIIISTEPKAHYMYLEFALKNDIHVLTDKPITVTKNMTNLKSIKKVRQQYYEILELAKNSKANCKVMCQRQYHKGYELVKELLNEVVYKYQIPITDIEIFHSDGNWEMPHDLDKENHPYKYGYGKLFHSGYHFIDLLSDLIKINNKNLGIKKNIAYGDVYSKVYTPNDEMQAISIKDYNRLFKEQEIPEFYTNTKQFFDGYGEKNYHGLLTFYNEDGFTITSANLNLLHDGVSRRAWIKSKDYYKSNGRIRHERINIEVGHLMNIQIHSYQSKEIIDRTDDEENVGGLEHFDIYIFRNPLISKEPFKKIKLGDLYSEKEKKEFMGYNELSREILLTNFLNNEECKGDIRNQALAIEILYSCSKGIYNHYANKNKVESVNINNDFMNRFVSTRLKEYSNPVDVNLEKINICNSIHYDDIYTIYAFNRYIPTKDCYEVYISIDDTQEVAGSLLDKTFKNKQMALLYYKYLEFIIKNKKMPFIEKLITK